MLIKIPGTKIDLEAVRLRVLQGLQRRASMAQALTRSEQGLLLHRRAFPRSADSAAVRAFVDALNRALELIMQANVLPDRDDTIRDVFNKLKLILVSHRVAGQAVAAKMVFPNLKLPAPGDDGMFSMADFVRVNPALFPTFAAFTRRMERQGKAIGV